MGLVVKDIGILCGKAMTLHYIIFCRLKANVKLTLSQCWDMHESSWRRQAGWCGIR